MIPVTHPSFRAGTSTLTTGTMPKTSTHNNKYASYLSLQRYLMRYLVKAPFPVREIGPVLTLLHACHVP
jgi:hypothetical protein